MIGNYSILEDEQLYKPDREVLDLIRVRALRVHFSKFVPSIGKKSCGW